MVDEKKSPVTGLYILDKSGIPLIARHYSDHLPENEAILLGGFFSAIDIFARTSLKTKLTDIGLESKRFFFRNADGYVLVALTNTEQDLIIDENAKTLVSIVQDRLHLMLLTILDVANENLLNSEELIKHSGTTLDSIVFESTFEEYDEVENVNMETGKSLDYTKITDNELLEKVKHLLN